VYPASFLANGCLREAMPVAINDFEERLRASIGGVFLLAKIETVFQAARERALRV